MTKQWRVKQGDVMDNNGEVIAVVSSQRGHNPEALGDAVLIAAAPSLKKALEDLLRANTLGIKGCTAHVKALEQAQNVLNDIGGN